MTPGTKSCVLLVFALGLVVFFRVIVPYPVVFRPDGVLFQGYDSGYHMRTVDALVANFPSRPDPDPYLRHPGSRPGPVAPLFGWLVAGGVIAVHGHTASEEEIDRVAAFVPPLVGAGVVVLTFLLAAVLFGARTAGLAAVFAAIIPGQLFSRSILGFTDQHVVESFFSTLSVILLCFVLKPGKCESRGQAVSKRNLGAAAAVGAVLWLYLLSWIGGALLIVCLGVWAAMQLCVDHYLGRSIAWAVPALLALVVALLLLLPFAGTYPHSFEQLLLLTGGASSLAIMALLSARFRERRMLPVLAAAAIATFAVTIFWLDPAAVPGLIGSVNLFIRGSQGISELQPLLNLPFVEVWNEFSSAWLLFPAGLWVLLAGGVFRNRARSLFLALSVLFLAVTIVRARFGYYSITYVAILAALALDQLLDRCRGRNSSRRPFVAGGLALLVLAAAFVPAVPAAIQRGRGMVGPGPEWQFAFEWMRAHTPAPLPAEAYFAPETMEPSDWASSYGVLTLWSHGYWLARTARRIPVANPRQAGAQIMGRFFAETDPVTAGELLSEVGVRYVMTDATFIATQHSDFEAPFGRFPTMLYWAGEDPNRFYEEFVLTDVDGLERSVYLFFPDYYRSMAVRLQLFGVEALTPQNTTWVGEVETSEVAPRRLSRLLRFKSYERAMEYLKLTPGAFIAGRNPHVSCVPLEAVQNHKLVYQSPGSPLATPTRPMAFLKVFEYTGQR